ncbi:MAG: Arc family DNA-binding protein [Trueperaceae bacterium]|nr:Arc family DNA-binding protein [Trueperaceae bacterium]
MAERKKFLLRVHPGLYAALEKWAADDLRSVNSQIEYLLAEALRKAGRSRVEVPEETAEDEG